MGSTLAELDARLEALESRLQQPHSGAGQGADPSFSSESCSDTLLRLTRDFHALVLEHPPADAVLRALRIHGDALRGGPASLEDLRGVCEAVAPSLRSSAQLLAAIDGLQQHVNPDSGALDGLDEKLDAFHTLLPAHLAQKADAVAFKEDLLCLMDAYHDVVVSVSQRLLRLDALVEKLEKQQKH